jgi:AraC-like DNA-binding protein
MLSCTKYPPSELLKQYVVHYWTTTVEQTGDIFVIPDAFPELLFNYDTHFSTTVEGNKFSGMSGGLVGQVARSAMFNATRGGNTLWVKLQPWTLSLLFDTPALEMNNRVIDAGELGDREFIQLVRTVTSMNSAEKAIPRIEDFLIRRIYRVNPGKDLVSSVVQRLFQHKGRITIDALAAEHGVGPRHLQYQFRDRIGLSPSYYRKEIRVKCISLLLARENLQANVSRLACNWGYTDQSHLNRDFKSIVQMTPFQYRKKILGEHISLMDLEADNGDFYKR